MFSLLRLSTVSFYTGVTALICLLPQSAKAGGWPIEEGMGWAKLSFAHLRSDRVFATDIDEGKTGCGFAISEGDRIPYDCLTGGVFQASALYFDLGVGVYDRIDLRLQLPVILNSFFDNSVFRGSRERGLGDIRIASTVAVLRDPLVLSLSWEVKAPTGNFTVDEVTVPLGEGQWDLSFRAHIAKSFGWIYAETSAGYRFRFPNPDAGVSGVNIGDEILWDLGTGFTPWKWVSIPLAMNLLWGADSVDDAEPRPRPARRVLYISPGLRVVPLAHLHKPWKNMALGFGVRIPVWGRNWPADPIWTLSLSAKTRLWKS